MLDRLILFGSGGHAKVVLDTIRAGRLAGEVAILDDDDAAAGRLVLGEPVRGGRGWLAGNWPEALVLPAIGSNAARAALIDWLAGEGRRLAVVVHRQATASPKAALGPGTFLAPGAIVNAGAELGEGVIVNTGASVDHDCRIGRAAHVAPGAHLCGGVSVGERTLIGAGATVIPGVAIGRDAVIGAGSTVIRDVPDGARVAGSPARPIGGPGPAGDGTSR